MASFNRVILVGNITRDPQVKYTQGNTAVCELGLAINSSYTKNGQKQERCDFVDVTLWGRTAEVAGEYLQKGRQVLIEGRLQLDTWDDRESGQKRSKLKVIGEQMTMLGQKDGNRQGGGGHSSQGGQQQSEPDNSGSDTYTGNGGFNPNTDEVPF